MDGTSTNAMLVDTRPMLASQSDGLTVTVRRDEIEAAWSWVGPILDAWANSNERPRFYSAGSWGPSSAIALIERDGRTWSEDAD